MSKQEIRLFFTSFTLTMIFFGFIGAFMLVDANSSRKERGSDDKIFSLTQSEDDLWALAVLGREATLTLDPVRRLGSLHAEYASLLMPRNIYALCSMVDYSSFWGNQFYKKYKEDVYLQEVGGFPEDSPPVLSQEMESMPEN